MPMPKRPLSAHEQDSLQTLGQHMGNPLDQFDMDVVDKIQQLQHEASFQKMHAAQTGGASESGLGPSDIEKEQLKQQQAQAQQYAIQQASQAQAAQSQQTSPTPPPAPSRAAGTTEPYKAQQIPTPPPSGQDVEPEVPGVQSPASQQAGEQQPPQGQ